MTVSVFIAKFLGIGYLLFGLGLVFNKNFYSKLLKEMIGNISNLYFGAVMAFITGFLIVFYHNVWEYNWTVLITIFGWVGLVKGIMMLVFPKFVESYSKPIFKSRFLSKLLPYSTIALGLLFAYFGFF